MNDNDNDDDDDNDNNKHNSCGRHCPQRAAAASRGGTCSSVRATSRCSTATAGRQVIEDPQ